MSGSEINLSINVFDSIILGILFVSALVAFFRGFIREFLSLVAFVGAAVITLYFFPQTSDAMKNHVKNEHVAAGVGVVGTYVASLITISIFNAVIVRYIKKGPEVGLLDNFLGLVFGSIRGVFIVSLGFLIMSAFVSKEKPPEWLKTSFTKEYLKEGGDVILQIAPTYIKDLEGIIEKQTRKASKDEQGKDDAEAPKVYKPEPSSMIKFFPKPSGENKPAGN